MSPEVILVSIMVAPLVLLVMLRASGALVFLSLCLGDVLVQFTSHDAVGIVAGAASGMRVAESFVKLGLLLAPALLTLLFMIGSVHGKYKRWFNILPAAGVGLLAGLLAVPLLPPGLSHNIMVTSLWRNIQLFQPGLVALSTFLCLLFLWLQRPKASHEDKHGKKHGK